MLAVVVTLFVQALGTNYTAKYQVSAFPESDQALKTWLEEGGCRDTEIERNEDELKISIYRKGIFFQDPSLSSIPWKDLGYDVSGTRGMRMQSGMMYNRIGWPTILGSAFVFLLLAAIRVWRAKTATSNGRVDLSDA